MDTILKTESLSELVDLLVNQYRMNEVHNIQDYGNAHFEEDDYKALNERFDKIYKHVEKLKEVGYGVVTIPKDYYHSLERDSHTLEFLKIHGVDNWVGYGDAMADVREVWEDESI